MSLHRMQVFIPATSAVAADGVVNVWHFNFTEDTVGPAAAVVALDNFYTAWQNYRAAAFSWQSATVKVYDLEDAKPRVPIFTSALPMSPTGTTGNIPSEVAMCMSFQAVAGSGLNQARRRNRVYLGPLAPSAHGTDGRPSGAFLADLDTAATALLAASNGSSTWKWAIFSTFWTPPGDGPLVNNGWFDNAFDTQRRRGLSPTAKTLF